MKNKDHHHNAKYREYLAINAASRKERRSHWVAAATHYLAASNADGFLGESSRDRHREITLRLQAESIGPERDQHELAERRARYRRQ